MMLYSLPTVLVYYLPLALCVLRCAETGGSKVPLSASDGEAAIVCSYWLLFEFWEMQRQFAVLWAKSNLLEEVNSF